ncbi:MAG: hypothetical protein E3J21_10460 [Anaerolineales bacterium]|nr:MAG: hypothetical protein E3J21_10460 [Anaerolineales bacterium]
MDIKEIFVSHRYWIGMLLLLAFISACSVTPTEAPPTPQPPLVPTEPAAAPTETPTPAPTATAAPEATAEPQGAWQPLSPDVCDYLAGAMAYTLGVDVATAEAPFQDYITGKAGTGCQATATGTGLDFENFAVVADGLRGMLETRGWQEDSMYAADGPTGTATGFRKGSGLCLLNAGWEPSQDANCPQDQPISACQLTPEQQLYTIVLNCAQEISPEIAELKSMIEATLPPTPTPDTSGFSLGGIAEVGVLPLTVSSGSQPLWAVFSIGMCGFGDPLQNHFIAIYTRNDAGWQELTLLELGESSDPEAFGPDYIFEGAVSQMNVEPSRLWLQIEGGVGAHGGAYHLLSFDGQTLKVEVANFNPSPGGNRLEELNGDGLLEVVLDATDPYVFCYACGVRLTNFAVLRWDGSQMVEVPLTPLPESAPADLRDLNNRAVELAQAGLWKDALATIEQAQALDAQDEAVAWNATLIRLTAEGRRPHEYEGYGYPLLENVFYGDYATALDIMRGYSVEELLSQPSPLVVGTVAESWEDALVQHIQVSASQALQAQPDLAAAWFLRGWATHLVNPGSTEAQADIERAAALDPNEPLFTQSVAYLKGM